MYTCPARYAIKNAGAASPLSHERTRHVLTQAGSQYYRCSSAKSTRCGWKLGFFARNGLDAHHSKDTPRTSKESSPEAAAAAHRVRKFLHTKFKHPQGALDSDLQLLEHIRVGSNVRFKIRLSRAKITCKRLISTVCNRRRIRDRARHSTTATTNKGIVSAYQRLETHNPARKHC